MPWSQEEKFLAEPWVQNSKDPRLGVGQDLKMFWQKFVSEYDRQASFHIIEDMVMGFTFVHIYAKLGCMGCPEPRPPGNPRPSKNQNRTLQELRVPRQVKKLSRRWYKKNCAKII